MKEITSNFKMPEGAYWASTKNYNGLSSINRFRFATTRIKDIVNSTLKKPKVPQRVANVLLITQGEC